MLSRTLRAIPVAKNIVAPKRQMGGIPSLLQKTVWKKSNVAYITYVVVGLVAAEFVYGTATNYIWEQYNYGKLYHQIDWSKFKTDDDA
eukprot:gene8474-9340_t